MKKLTFLITCLGLISCATLHPQNDLAEDERHPSSVPNLAPGLDISDRESCKGDGYVTSIKIDPNGDVEYSTLYGGDFRLLSRNVAPDAVNTLSRSIASQYDKEPVYVARTYLKATDEIVSIHHVPKCEAP